MKLKQVFCYNPAVIIDFHTHIFSPQIKSDRTPYLSDPCFAELYSDKRARLATAEDLIESMDREGIDISVALNIGWNSNKFCIETNDYILESVSRYPKRLVGFCSVSLNSKVQSLKEIERCVQAGAKGIGELRPDTHWLSPGNASVWKPFKDTVKKHEMILLTHSSEPVGHAYQGKGEVTPEVLQQFLTVFEGLPLVCAHWGGGLPFYALMPEVRRLMRQTYFDSAASPFLYNPEVYSHVGRLAGVDKVLFGSDYPLLSPKRLIEEIDSLKLPAGMREQILGENARKLLGLK